MSDPTPFVPGYSYSGWQASNPSKPLPAPKIDNDFANIQNTTDETILALKDIRRSDGKLQNGIVTVEAMETSLYALIAAVPGLAAAAAVSASNAAASAAVALAASSTAVNSAAAAAISAQRALENATGLVIATQAQAEAGVLNDKGMTPLRTRQVIDIRQSVFNSIATATTTQVPSDINVVNVRLADVTGQFVRVASQPAHGAAFRTADRFLPDGSLNASNGGWWEFSENILDVRLFGAKGDGAASANVTTSAVKIARDWCVRGTISVAGMSDPVLSRAIKFGPGHYVINEAEALMTQATPVAKALGFRVIGAGSASTVVEYAPTAPGGFLFNNTRLLVLQFENMRFYSANALNSAFYNFMSGGNTPQDFRFFNVSFTGFWKHYFKVEGTNNNSELSWIKCRATGFVEAAIQTNNDQNLNYNFTDCDIWLSDTSGQSCFIDAVLGGHFKFLACDFSGLQNCVLFKLKGTTHSRGVCFFEAIGCRFELKSDLCKVIESTWPFGTVAFRDCDFSPNTASYSASTVAFDFVYPNSSGPQYIFEGCSLTGTTQVSHGNTTYQLQGRMVYRNCDFIQFIDIEDAFSLVSSTADGGFPPIVIDGCRMAAAGTLTFSAWGANTAYLVGDQRRNTGAIYTCTGAGTSAGSGGPTGKGTAIVDGTVTWSYARNSSRDYQSDQIIGWRKARGAPQRRYAIFRNSAGNMPAFADGSLEIILPKNAVIAATKIFSAAGIYSIGSTANFTIQTWEDTPTIFSTISSGALNAGFNADWTGFFECGTDIKRRSIRLVLGSSVTQAQSGSYALVEYIA